MNNIKGIIFLAISLGFVGCQSNNVDKNNEDPVVDSKSKYLVSSPNDS